jgi:hypothetical protein
MRKARGMAMENKWMTIEEFERLKTGNTYCWIVLDSDYITLAYRYDGDYYESANSSSRYSADEIKAVMPIEKPDYPPQRIRMVQHDSKLRNH